MAFKILPQQQPFASFRSGGQDVPVLITAQWWKALKELEGVSAPAPGPSPAPSPGGITFAGSPPYRYGDLVFTSGPLELMRLGAGGPGQVLTTQGPGSAPVWADLPAPPPPPAPPPIPGEVLCDDMGRLLLDQSSLILTDA
jgi:hypothetical protein